MKKASGRPAGELRREYKRADFGALQRGRYATKATEATNVVVLDPQVARAFPNDLAVNRALKGVLRARKKGPRARGATRSRRDG